MTPRATLASITLLSALAAGPSCSRRSPPSPQPPAPSSPPAPAPPAAPTAAPPASPPPATGPRTVTVRELVDAYGRPPANPFTQRSDYRAPPFLIRGRIVERLETLAARQARFAHGDPQPYDLQDAGEVIQLQLPAALAARVRAGTTVTLLAHAPANSAPPPATGTTVFFPTPVVLVVEDIVEAADSPQPSYADAGRDS